MSLVPEHPGDDPPYCIMSMGPWVVRRRPTLLYNEHGSRAAWRRPTLLNNERVTRATWRRPTLLYNEPDTWVGSLETTRPNV